jgi:diadenosine tetraphosphate (Ap4A) HIT family hydrolase
MSAEKNQVVCMENVQRYYGANPELLAKYEQTVLSGECPFCDPYIKNDFVDSTMHWHVVHNQFPYKYPDGEPVRLHLLVIPRRHLIRLDELLVDEWAGLSQVMQIVRRRFPFVPEGFGLGIRSDKVGGVTLYHLHAHIIVPQIGRDGQKPIGFGIG